MKKLVIYSEISQVPFVVSEKKNSNVQEVLDLFHKNAIHQVVAVVIDGFNTDDLSVRGCIHHMKVKDIRMILELECSDIAIVSSVPNIKS